MDNPEFITVQDLYYWAKTHRLLEARIRICDGMAVSFYPRPSSVSYSRYEIIVDLSADTPIEYDDLPDLIRESWQDAETNGEPTSRERFAIYGYGYDPHRR